MLTVHKLPLTHLFLADNQTAKEAREVGIMEAMVIIDRGLVVSVNTPPCEGDEFTSSDDWIFTAIRDAYERGTRFGSHRDEDMIEAGCLSSSGWTHWRDLTPGTVATSGDDTSDGRFVILGGPGCFTASGRAFNAAHIGAGPPFPFQYNPAAPPAWPFFKVLRSGLTGEQIHHLAAAVESGEVVEEALARLAPLAA